MRAFLTFCMVLLITGCFREPAQMDFSSAQDAMVGRDITDFSEPELIQTEESVSYRFERERIATDLYVDKTVELGTDGSGMITLEYSGDGEGEHIVFIPKSFGAHVDDIQFSVQPDEIINPDPKVKYIFRKANKRIRKIIMEVEETAFHKGGEELGDQLSQGLGELLSGNEPDLSQIAKKTKAKGTEAAIDKLLDNLDDFLFAADIQVCAEKQTEQERLLCILTLVSKEPDWFDCTEMFSNYEEYGTARDAMVLSCKAIQQDDPSLCHGAQFYDSAEYKNTEMSHKAICERQFFTIKLMACEGMFRDEKEQCVIDIVMGTGYTDACWSLFGEASEKCAAAAEGKEWDGSSGLDFPKKKSDSDTKTNPDAIPAEPEKDSVVPDTGDEEENSENEGEEEDCSAYDSESTRNSCYTSKAQKSGQLSFCEMVTGPTTEKQNEYLWPCYQKVAMAIPDPTICKKIDVSNYRYSDCIYQSSKLAKQPDACDMLLDKLGQYSVELCKGSVAEYAEDASICDGLTDEFAKNDCYDKVAGRKQDPSICDRISVESDKETCKKYAIPS